MEPIYFRSPWSRSLKINTSIFVGLLAIAMVFGGPIGLAFGGVFLLSATLLMVNGYSIQGGKVIVHGLLWRRIFDLCELDEIDLAPGVAGETGALFGLAGLFGVIGSFGGRSKDGYQAFITDSENAVVIDFFGKQVVVTPDDPVAFRAAVMAEYRRIHI